MFNSDFIRKATESLTNAAGAVQDAAGGMASDIGAKASGAFSRASEMASEATGSLKDAAQGVKERVLPTNAAIQCGGTVVSVGATCSVQVLAGRLFIDGKDCGEAQRTEGKLLIKVSGGTTASIEMVAQ